MQRIKKDDRVKITKGKDRGKEGRVVKVFRDRDRVLVEGVNYVTKHQPLRQNNRGAMEGGIIQTEAAVHVSNVMPICPSCGEATRVGFVITEDGDRRSKMRQCKKCEGTF